MYKVFVNDKPLFLTNQVQKETDFKLFLLESVDIKKLIVKIFQNKIQKTFLYHPDEKLIMKTLRAKLPVEKAGGGLVYNKDGDVLFIFRNGKWDLPKGGTEKNETIEETAMREVEEETGVTNLTLKKKIGETYHTYDEFGKHILKTTHWYYMVCPAAQNLVPQTEEDITETKWISTKDIKEPVANTYPSIKDILAKFFDEP